MQGALEVGLSLLGKVQGLACPIYCGGSLIPAFACGLTSGLLLGAGFTAWILFRPYIERPATWPPQREPFSPVVGRPASRLAGYLHE